MEGKRIWEAQELHWSLKQKQWEQEQEDRIIKCICECNTYEPTEKVDCYLPLDQLSSCRALRHATNFCQYHTSRT